MTAPKKRFSMARTWQRIRTVPGLKRDVAALAVLIVAAVISTIGINHYLNGKALFAKTVSYRAEFANVDGLNPNATTHFVSIAGVRLGRVSKWEPTNHGTAIVTMELTPPFGTIYDNATAVLRPKNPLNDMSITISPGGPPGHPMPENGLIPVSQTRRPIAIPEALGHLDERTQQAVEDLVDASDIALANAPQQLPGGVRAVDGVFNSLRPVAEALQVRRDNIARLVTALGQIATGLGGDHDRAVKLAGATQATLQVLADNDKNLTGTLDQLPGLSHQLHDALAATQQLTKQLNPTLDNLSGASGELPKALDRFQDTVHELDRFDDKAEPFLDRAKPVVADLRPVISDVVYSLHEIHPVTQRLDRDTRVVGLYLSVIQNFVANTASVFGVHDAQGGNIRGHFVAHYDAGHSLPGGDPGYAPSPADAGTGPGVPSGATPAPFYIPGADDFDPGYNERHGSQLAHPGGHR